MKIGSLVGEFGKYHAFICFLISLSTFSTGFDNMVFLYLAPPTNYSCHMNRTDCCSNPVYDKRIFHRTIVTDWNLICARSWLQEFNQILFQVGIVSGSLIFGKISDRYGRRLSLLVASITHIFSSLIELFMPDYWSLLVWRMILGMSEGGVMVVSFVLLMEYTDMKYRVIVSTLFHAPFVLGHIVLTLCAYYTRDYVTLLLIISMPNLTLLIYICFLTESPEWLLATNQIFKAIKLLEHIAKINNKPTGNIGHQVEIYQYYIRSDKERKESLADVFRRVAYRDNLIVVCLLWFLGGLCFYGGIDYIIYMSEDIFLNEIIAGTICLCGCFIFLPLTIYLRRRILVVFINISCGFFFLTVPFFHGNTGAVIFVCIGTMFSFMNFIVVYLYSFEVFPIVIRNVAFAFTSIMSRVGVILSLFVVRLHVYGIWCGPIVFGLVSTVSAFFFLYFLPDIRDCDVEEIELEVLEHTRVINETEKDRLF